MTVCKSRVDHLFEGYFVGTVYQLDDGSKWRVIVGVGKFGRKMRPLTTITKKHGRYFMSVVGVKGVAEVEPIRLPPTAPRPAVNSTYMDPLAGVDSLIDMALNSMRRGKKSGS